MRFAIKCWAVEHTSGRVTLTPLDVPELAVHADSMTAAAEELVLALDDQIVPYRPLGRDVIQHIARQALTAALAREGLQRRGTSVTFDDEVVDILAAAEFDPLLGVRPLKRAIERLVVASLADVLGSSPRAPSRLHLRRGEAGELEIVSDADPPRPG